MDIIVPRNTLLLPVALQPFKFCLGFPQEMCTIAKITYNFS